MTTNPAQMPEQSGNIDARIIDGKLFVDMDMLLDVIKNGDSPFRWTAQAANAMKFPDDIAVANAMGVLVEWLDASAMSLWEELS